MTLISRQAATLLCHSLSKKGAMPKMYEATADLAGRSRDEVVVEFHGPMMRKYSIALLDGLPTRFTIDTDRGTLQKGVLLTAGPEIMYPGPYQMVTTRDERFDPQAEITLLEALVGEPIL